MNPQDMFYVGKIGTGSVPLNKYFKTLPKVDQIPDCMGRIRTVYLLCTRITLETTALRVT